MGYVLYSNKMSYNKIYSNFFVTKSISKESIIFLIVIILCSLNTVVSQECRQINNCKCKFTNGSVIDLSSIGKHYEARFQNVTPTNAENYRYYYNPCYPFTLGEGACTNVAVCQVTKSKPLEYQNCGSPNNGFIWSAQRQSLNLMYSAPDNRVTNVYLVCSKEAIVPTLVVKGETGAGTKVYEMTLTSRCACPDLCREDHLSAGSVLVILFLIFVSLYLVLGIIHSSLTRGAHGWELIPHYEFWADFPLLVRDGCVFVMNGCKAETAYERI